MLDGRKTPICEYIGIDEFKLHKGHRYATVVTDLKSGHVLFLEAGKSKEQAYHFFSLMGDEWMRHVKAVAMDMNAQYDSAFRERWPGIRIVYDHFHLVKMYNDTVLTAIRRRKQREMLENGDAGEWERERIHAAEELQIPPFIQNGHSERDGQRSP